MRKLHDSDLLYWLAVSTVGGFIGGLLAIAYMS